MGSRADTNQRAVPQTSSRSAPSRDGNGHRPRGGVENVVLPEDAPYHGWYRFVLAFPPHLVRDYLRKFELGPSHRVLDPFCGTGTTLVECKRQGIPSVGIEANPMACFASQVKTDWTPDPGALLAHARGVAEAAFCRLARDGVEDTPLPINPHDGAGLLRSLPPDKLALLLKDSISPLPLHKALVLADVLGAQHDERYSRHERLAFAQTLVYGASNLRFGPEVGVGAIKEDGAVIAPWLAAVKGIASDLRRSGPQERAPAVVFRGDSRSAGALLEPASVDAVITSPPYPNEKDYTRTTRLESVLLGFIDSKQELRALKRGLVRSNTRGVYKGDDDDGWVKGFPAIQRVADQIEQRRVELGKTSGFERLYARVTRLYFGGMARHLAELRPVLRPGARLAYVLGDQASYLRVMIRTSELLAEVAASLGYRVLGADLFRTRFATATLEQMREDVLLLEWPGSHDHG